MLAVSWSSSEHFTRGASSIQYYHLDRIVLITEMKCLGELLGTTNTKQQSMNLIKFILLLVRLFVCTLETNKETYFILFN